MLLHRNSVLSDENVAIKNYLKEITDREIILIAEREILRIKECELVNLECELVNLEGQIKRLQTEQHHL